MKVSGSNSTRRSVLITGATGGIGRACTKILQKQGYVVFAGVRTQEQVTSVHEAFANDDVVPLLLDVTDADHIVAAARVIEQRINEQCWHFCGVVNNAAHEYLGALELLPMKCIRHEMEVGFFGPLALIKQFLPMLRQSPQARIINISSIHGLVSVPTAGSGCIAKRSIEALSDVLRLELMPWKNINVSTVNPGPIATPLWDKTQQSFEQLASMISDKTLDLYYADWTNVVDNSRADTHKIYTSAVQPETVAKAIFRALTVRRPRVRYLVGWEARRTYFLYRLLPTRWLDRINARTYNYGTKERESDGVAYRSGGLMPNSR